MTRCRSSSSSDNLLTSWFLVFFTFLINSSLQLPQLCTYAPSITFRGANDVVANNRNSAFLVVFTPLQCANCYNYLRRLNDIVGSSRHPTKIFVIAPDFESNHIISRTSSAFPNLKIDRTGEGWPKYSAKNFDAWVIDKCGRVSEVFEWPNSDVSSSQSIRGALDSACAGHSKCGACQQGYRAAPIPAQQTKKISAYIREEEIRKQQVQQRQRQQQNAQNYGQYQQQQLYNYQQNVQAYPPTQTTTPTPPPIVKTTTTTTTSDYEDYYQNDENDNGKNGLVKTTAAPQTQIPRPPEINPNWPTFPPYILQQHQQYFQQMGYPGYQQMLPQFNQQQIMVENNLPCTAFTDDICYQQQERQPNLPMPKCCNKGVYITDVCVPGKCSNSTVQLCCLQKFLQAKYACCSDPSQEDSKAPTNKFNKCCYDVFSSKDDCCSEEAAAKYWSSVYEVCTPTTDIDYSSVRFEVKLTDPVNKVHFTEGVRVVDLNTNRRWDFNCTYGRNRIQYSYLPLSN